MALTLTELFKSEVEGRRMHVYTILFDDAYATGGESVAPGDVALTRIDSAIIAPADGFLFEWDQTNKKIKAFYADYDAVSDGKLIQVADTTDINANLTAVLGIFFGL